MSTPVDKNSSENPLSDEAWESLEIEVGYSEKSHQKLGVKDFLKVTVQNNSDNAVPEQRLTLRPNKYYRFAMTTLPEIKSHEEVSVDFDVEVKDPGNRSIESLCRSIAIEFDGFKREHEHKTKIANYSRRLGDFSPSELLKKANKDHSEIEHYNILLFGIAGASKSSFINTTFTMLQGEDDRKLSRIAAAGGGGDHATQSLSRFQVWQFHSHLRFNIWDTWGLDKSNYDPDQVTLLMSGKLPPGWKMGTEISDHTDRFQKLAQIETLSTQMHAVVFFVPQGLLSDFDEDDVKRIQQMFQCLIQEEYNPLVILSKVDEVEEKLRENPLEKYDEIEGLRRKTAGLFKIGLNSVRYTVNYLSETTRNWDIEALAYENLTAILESCESFVESRVMRFGKVGRTDVVDDSGLVWPDELELKSS